jgi:hypothetical protein
MGDSWERPRCDIAAALTENKLGRLAVYPPRYDAGARLVTYGIAGTPSV